MTAPLPSPPPTRAPTPPARPGTAAPLGSLALLAGAAAGGAAAATTWGVLPALAWWPGVLLGLVALGLVARRWLGLTAVDAARTAASAAAEAATRQHVAMLERRARQFDEAEQLVALGSYDWWPARDELHWSEQHYRLWGHAPGAVVPTFEVFRRGLHPDDAERVLAELQRALDGRGRYDCAHRVQRADGSVIHVRACGEVFFDTQGRAERMIGAVLDISERVQTEARLRLNAFVLDTLPDAVSAIDAQRQYRLANAAWYQVTGVTRKPHASMHFDHVFPLVASPERRLAIDRCLTDGLSQTVRGPNPAAPHADQVFETRYLPFRDPAVDWHGVVMVSRDVTEDEALRQRLLHSVENLSLTLETIGDAIFATDAHGPDDPVLFANRQLRQLWQIPDTVQPLTARRIIDHARGFFVDVPAELARIEAIIAGNLAADDRLTLNDGRVVQRRCIPTTGHGREVRIWVFRDITAEARAQGALQTAEARQRDLLEAFPGYIWAVDADHRLVYVNPRAAAVYEPVVARPGMPAAALFGEDIYARVRPAVEHALGGDAISFEWQRVNSQPRLPDVLLVRMTPGVAADGRPMCYAFGVDITSLKQARDALRLAKDEAERASAAKTQFLSAISHELRTPLNAVIGFSQLLESNDSANLTDRQRRQLGEVRKAGSHLLALINDLLDLARIEAGRVDLDLQPVPLDAVVDDCLPLLMPQARERGCTLARDTGGAWMVRADRMRLKQVLLNLLSNAVKYNRPQGQVGLHAQRDGDQLRITVRDEGPGLTADAQAQLFQPFERLGADRSGVPGTGIGLALSRQLVLAMGGTIGVDSEPGQGSRFWLRLPLVDTAPPVDAEPATVLPEPASPAPAAAVPAPPHVPAPALATAPAPAAEPAATTATRLAYIDDNPVNLVLMEGLLEERPGFLLRTFDDARAALRHLAEFPAHLVLVDLQMPDLDGFGLFHALRSHPVTRATPVVAVTADATAATMARCRELGFAGYVTKPIDAEQLHASIDHVLAGGPFVDPAPR